MQPYFFPYVGYFALAYSVDRFVFYDDVQFIKNGWINRNRILIAGKPAYLTVPLSGASSSRLIQDVGIDQSKPWRRKILGSLRQAYGGAPFFDPVGELVRSVVETDRDGIADLARASVRAVARYLDLATTFVPNASDYENSHLRGVERVKDICRLERATSYHNLPGGRSLYAHDEFRACGLSLHFIGTALPRYQQFDEPFVPGLSVIDVLMHNPPQDIRGMLAELARDGDRSSP